MSRCGHVVACAAGFIALALGGPALAEAAPITGTLDRPGYTVLALADTGQASSVVARDGRFSLEPPATTATLHLRAPDGTYAGPVVLVPQAISVRKAQAAVAKAARKVKRAERNVSAARRRVNSARGGPARRRAARLLRQARQQLTKARRQLTEAKLVLADAQLQAITVERAGAAVADAARKVKRAERNVSAARRRVNSARGGPARRRAARLLRQARQQLTKARRQLTEARRLLAAKQQQVNQAILGVKAGAPLGSVAVNSVAGYALSRVNLRVRRTWVDASRSAQAVNGVPIGAGNFGRVRSNGVGRAVPGDLDVDGVPEPLDIDDDGDLVLDNLDASTAVGRARAAETGGCGPANIYCPAVYSGLLLFLQETVNANAGSSTDAINAAFRASGHLVLSIQGGGPRELDCGDPNSGLVYCRQNGSTGTGSAGASGGPAFPGPPGGAFDSDSDGFGVLNPALEPLACGGGCPDRFFLLHGAATDQIGSGDVLVEHIATGGDTSQCPPPAGTTNNACGSLSTTLQYVFATVPALVRYSDTAGHAATVSYPVPPGGPGTETNGFPVSPGPDGNIVATLTFWRPQRRAIPRSDPPTATWMDVGHLTYSAFPAGGPSCPQSAFAEDDPNLTPATPHVFLQGGGGFEDAKNDEASSPGDTAPGRTFTYRLNLTQCVASEGMTFDPGQTLTFNFIAAPGAPAFATQVLWFKRE